MIRATGSTFTCAGRFLLRFALATALLAWWCPFVLGSRLRFRPGTARERLAGLKLLVGRSVWIFAASGLVWWVGFLLHPCLPSPLSTIEPSRCSLVPVLGRVLQFADFLGRTDFTGIAVATLLIVVLWWATEEAWRPAPPAVRQQGRGIRHTAMCELGTFLQRGVAIFAATIVAWWVWTAIRPCLPLGYGGERQCSLANVVWRAAGYAYKRKGFDYPANYPDYESAFIDGLAIAVVYLIVIAIAAEAFAVAFAMAFLWRVAEAVANLWRVIEKAMRERRMPPTLGTASLLTIATVIGVCLYELAIVLRPCWSSSILGPISAVVCVLHDAHVGQHASAFPPTWTIAWYLLLAIGALAAVVLRLAWSRWQQR